MDAFIILLIVIVIICWSCYRRKLSKAAYGIVCLDIILRILAFLAQNINIPTITPFFARFPNSLLGVADKYTSGLVYFIIAWLFVVLVIYFVIMSLRTFFKK